MSYIEETCTEIGKPIIEEMGYTLVDVEYVKERKLNILRYLIDSEKGVDIDDCALISERISKALDKVDPIKEEYMLEICSPGIERPLKTREDIKNAINKYVNVKLYAPKDGQKEFEGDLIGFENDVLTISYKDKTSVKTIKINYNEISKIRLAVKF
ncbi:MAG TPA: ribosome maturation factor RimP [Haloplasmataceae bacterium]